MTDYYVLGSLDVLPLREIEVVVMVAFANLFLTLILYIVFEKLKLTGLFYKLCLMVFYLLVPGAVYLNGIDTQKEKNESFVQNRERLTQLKFEGEYGHYRNAGGIYEFFMDGKMVRVESDVFPESCRSTELSFKLREIKNQVVLIDYLVYDAENAEKLRRMHNTDINSGKGSMIRADACILRIQIVNPDE